jgi:hypothetical protein
MERNKWMDRQMIDTHIDEWADIHTYRQTDRQADRLMVKCTNMQTDGQMDKQTD